MTDKHQDDPYVIHVSEMDQHPGAVYIGRGMPGRGVRPPLRRSRWANPFRITPDQDRAESIDLFRLHMTVGEGRHLIPDLPSLQGRPLACWCRRHGETVTDQNRCHGDVLVDLVRKYREDNGDVG